VNNHFIGASEAPTALITDVWLLECVLRPTMIQQFLTRYETSTAIVAQKVCDSIVEARVISIEKAAIYALSGPA
jgi:hypothetical protein